MLESYNTHTYKAQSQPNKTDFYQQVLAEMVWSKPEMEAFTSFFRTYHLTVVNARMYR
jgi:hypothetical protein